MSKKIEVKTEEPVNLMREWKLKHWEDRIANYNKKENMEPGRINGFDGTFAISQTSAIPEDLLGFLNLHFNAGKKRRAKYSIEDINVALNEIWEGPGSMEKICRLEMEYDYDLVHEEEEV
tara:strand:+ start:136 stop:495 length:360 start_codon:yes stop_codon:yes gene_type:complete